MLIDAAMMQACASQVHNAVTYAIVKTESNFNPWVIGVNRSSRLAKQPNSYQEAVYTAKRLIQDGKNIDLGLAQINSSNLGWLGLSIEQVLEPCHNLKAMEKVLLACLQKAGEDGQGSKMQRAWSCYNTGSITKGFNNGYVTKVTNHYNSVFASLSAKNATTNKPHAKTSSEQEKQAEDAIKTYASWDVFKDF